MVLMDTIHKSRWAVTEAEFPTDKGLYQIWRVGSEWSARFLPTDAQGADYSRRQSIDCVDGDGNPSDWPLLSCAQLACETHHERMTRFGESPAVAAAFIAANTDVFDFRKVG